MLSRMISLGTHPSPRGAAALQGRTKDLAVRFTPSDLEVRGDFTRR